MHVGFVESGVRAIVIDDLVATGGTLSGAIKILERVGAEVVECACVIGLPEVKGSRRETRLLGILSFVQYGVECFIWQGLSLGTLRTFHRGHFIMLDVTHYVALH